MQDNDSETERSRQATVAENEQERGRPHHQTFSDRLTHWLMQGHRKETIGNTQQEAHSPQHPWWQVMCLTGVDYFSTLGYQPGIAALAAGALSPLATLVLVLLTLFGALPIYYRVARDSPEGEGSIFMLERLLSWWTGKIFVLCLLGFVATDFIITITLSSADATAHLVENPLMPLWLQNHPVPVTLALIGLLGAVFLKGFKEAIGVAVLLVVIYLLMNCIVIAEGILQIIRHPDLIVNWKTALVSQHGSPLMMLAVALLLFPKLALGMSGFETGVAVMPLVQGNPGYTAASPDGRVRNTRKLLLCAALIMSVFLLTSSLVTTLLIPAHEFQAAGAGQEAGKANGRALAYLAHLYLGNAFGTAYDLSTIAILWFAGASAMAGLLNIVPRYLPRYGMAPDWSRATRPLVLVYMGIAAVVTIIFHADVDAQGGAYATGVLVLMSSAAVAVTLAAWRKSGRGAGIAFSLITLVFLYTTITNAVERPDGIKIASFFIGAIIATSLLSRVWRSTELRVKHVEMDAQALQFLKDIGEKEVRLIANRRMGNTREYPIKEQAQRESNHIPLEDPVLFVEVDIGDPSRFEDILHVHGLEIDGYRVLRAEGAAVPNSIAALLLHICEITGEIPHAYFSWSEGNPILFLIRYVIFGEGDTAPLTHEVLRQAEPDPARRPAIHVGGER